MSTDRTDLCKQNLFTKYSVGSKISIIIIIGSCNSFWYKRIYENSFNYTWIELQVTSCMEVMISTHACIKRVANWWDKASALFRWVHNVHWQHYLQPAWHHGTCTLACFINLYVCVLGDPVKHPLSWQSQERDELEMKPQGQKSARTV